MSLTPLPTSCALCVVDSKLRHPSYLPSVVIGELPVFRESDALAAFPLLLASLATWFGAGSYDRGWLFVGAILSSYSTTTDVLWVSLSYDSVRLIDR